MTNGIFLKIDRSATPCFELHLLRIVVVDAAKDGMNLGDQHIKMKRLLDKVIRSKLHRHHHICRMVARREKDNRHIRMCSNHPAPVEAIEFGQLNIYND
ncbi:hypothetical protein D3C85_1651240 [compost metagenome]